MVAPPFERLNPDHFVGQVAGEPVALLTLRHSNGMEVAVCNQGARVLQILVPDRLGQLGDVALGYDSLAALQAGTPSMGAFIGRYAGRIGLARYTLDGTSYPLEPNLGLHTLHGGPRGSRHRVFTAQQDAPDRVTLRLRFEPSIDGHPGTIDLTLTYRLTEDHTLVVEHEAVCVSDGSPASPASFTPHIFFNLDGHGHGNLDDHHLKVLADQLLASDADNVATGAMVALDGHALDLLPTRRLGDLPAIDHAFLLPPVADGVPARLCARAHTPLSGRTLEVWTTEPVLQVYSAAALGTGAKPDIGKQGLHHRPHGGLCLEPQQYPNAPNCPEFPILRVAPYRPYRAQTRYRFGLLD